MIDLQSAAATHDKTHKGRPAMDRITVLDDDLWKSVPAEVVERPRRPARSRSPAGSPSARTDISSGPTALPAVPTQRPAIWSTSRRSAHCGSRLLSGEQPEQAAYGVIVESAGERGTAARATSGALDPTQTLAVALPSAAIFFAYSPVTVKGNVGKSTPLRRYRWLGKLVAITQLTDKLATGSATQPGCREVIPYRRL